MPGVYDLLRGVECVLQGVLKDVMFSNIELVYIHALIRHFDACPSEEWSMHRILLTYTPPDRLTVAEKISVYLESDKPFSFSLHDLAVLYETIDCIAEADLDVIDDWSEGTYGSLNDEGAMLTRISRLLRGDSTTSFTHFDLSYFDAALRYLVDMQASDDIDLPFMSYTIAHREELSGKISRYLNSQNIS